MSMHIVDEVAQITSRLQIHSARTFSYGEAAPVTVVARHSTHNQNSAQSGGAWAVADDADLIDSIRNFLYSNCYIRISDPQTEPGGASAHLGSPPYAASDGGAGQPGNNFAAVLAHANPTRDRWDGGWTIYQLNSDGRIMVQKGERSRSAVAGEYAANKWPGMMPGVGEQVNLRVYPGSDQVQPAFYFGFSETLPDQFDEYDLLRFYFNVRASGASELFSQLAASLNHYLLPFSFKTLLEPNAYHRADAAVLYVARRYYQQSLHLVSQVAMRMQAYLRPATPLFSKTILPGLAVAQDPGNGESFGMHRCRLLAEALVAAWRGGVTNLQARMALIEQRFRAQGIDLATPYLGADTQNIFATPVFAGGIAL